MNLAELLNGFAVALSPNNLLFALIGVLVGSLVGVLPGIGPLLTMAILLPVTYTLDPTTALIMLAGIYYGAMYGGSTTSIMLNLPGENASVVTAIDGYKLRLAGRAGAALGMAASASFVGGIVAVSAMALLATPMSKAALAMGPPENLVLLLVALALVGVLSGKRADKGLVMATLGLVIATVGTDLFTGQPRLTFDITPLVSGVEIICVIIGIFAIGEVLYARPAGTVTDHSRVRMRTMIPTRADYRVSALPIARSSVLGTGLGVMPGAGPTVSSYIAYGVEKLLAKDKTRFGRGAIEGVAAPEAANNSASTGAMIPLLTLGIPGSAAAAVLLQAFIVHGLQPGPSLFRDHPDVAWGLIASMFVGNIMLVILMLPLVGVFLQMLRLPYPFLSYLTVLLAVLGAYSIASDLWEVWVMAAFGVIGLLARLFDYPLAPLALAVVLGNLVETNLRQTLLLSDSGIFVIFQRPASLTIMAAFAVAVLLWAAVRIARRAKSSTEMARDEASEVTEVGR